MLDTGISGSSPASRVTSFRGTLVSGPLPWCLHLSSSKRVHLKFPPHTFSVVLGLP